MISQRWFILAVAVVYGLSTADTAVNGMIDNLAGHPVRLGVSIAVLAGVVATICDWTTEEIRSTRAAVQLNRVIVIGLTILMVVAAITSWPQSAAFIEAGCVLVAFILLPSLQALLRKAPPRKDR